MIDTPTKVLKITIVLSIGNKSSEKRIENMVITTDNDNSSE